MRTLRFAVMTLALMLGWMAVCPAQSLSPKRLNTDPNLAALIAVRGRFQSLIVDEQRNLTLPVWAADFSPNETVDFDQLVTRAFSELDLPEEAGWGLFEPVNNSLEIQVRFTDQLGRLGRVEFRSWEAGQLLSSIWANSWRTEASGVFSIPSDLREMVAVVLNDTGGVLARIAVDVGTFDTVVPIVVEYGSFTPYYAEPIYCAHFGERPGDVYGDRSGDPYTEPGTKTYISGTGRSGTTVYQDFTNDSSGTIQVLPPEFFWKLWRKKTIANTVAFNKYKVADAQAMASLEAKVNAAAAEDTSRPLSPVQALPYSEGCARWRVGFTGRATSVLAIPYERKRRNASLNAFLNTLASLFSPQRGFLSALLANLANEWLRDRQNQEASGLKPNEVVAWGDVYRVETESVTEVPRWVNTTQEWRVYVKARYPNGTEAPTSGTVTIETVQPLDQPSPPRGPSYYQVLVPPEGKVFRLGKGWRYRFLVGGTEQLQVNVPAANDIPTVTLYINIAPAGSGG